MKSEQLVSGKTYVGKNGRMRLIISFIGNDAVYDDLEWRRRDYCSKDTFARWAEREATADEAAL